MPHPSVPACKTLPPAVRHARAALARLKREDPVQADLLEKILPAYALRVAQDGGDTSTAALLAAARQGHGFIKGAFQHTARRADLLATYRRIKPGIAEKPQHARNWCWSDLLAPVAENYTGNTTVPLDAFLDILAKAAVPDARRASHTTYVTALTQFYDAVAQKDTERATAAWLALYAYAQYNSASVLTFHRALLRHAEVAGGTYLSAEILYNTAARYSKSPPERWLAFFPESAAGEAVLNRILDKGIITTSLSYHSGAASMIYTYSTATLLRILEKTQHSRALISNLFHHRRGDVISSLIDKDDGQLWGQLTRQAGLSHQKLIVAAIQYADIALFKRISATGSPPPTRNLDLDHALRGAAFMTPEVFDLFQKELPLLADDKNLHILLATALFHNTPLLDTLIARIPADTQAAARVIDDCLNYMIYKNVELWPPGKKRTTALDRLTRLPAFEKKHYAPYLQAAIHAVDKPANNIYAETLAQLPLTPQDRADLICKLRPPYANWSAILGNGPVAQHGLDHALQIAIKSLENAAHDERRQYMTTLAMQLIEAGARDTGLNDRQKHLLTQTITRMQVWQKSVRQNPPFGLADHDPSFFKPALFEKICLLLKEEKYYGRIAHEYAYAACAVFGNEERLSRYLEKWADTQSRQPLHNLLQALQLPPASINKTNIRHWGDAILRHGPAMGKLLRFADRIPNPLKNDTGEWSLTRTRMQVSTFAYARATEHPALAALCYQHEVSEKDFSAALDLVKTTPAHYKNIPDITINGHDFDMPDARFRRLASGDIRGLFLGELTDCCQSIGSNGDVCARTGYTSPDSGFYVVETDKGEIIGQSWAWRGTQGELCFDSLETLGKRISDAQWQKIVTTFAARLHADPQHDVTAVTVGAGGETPVTFAAAFARTSEHYARHALALAARNAPVPKQPDRTIAAAQPRLEVSYLDSKRQYVIWHAGQQDAKENNQKKQFKSKP